MSKKTKPWRRPDAEELVKYLSDRYHGDLNDRAILPRRVSDVNSGPAAEVYGLKHMQ